MTKFIRYFLLLTTILSQSCISKLYTTNKQEVHDNISIEANTIPPDYGKENDCMLFVLTEQKKLDKHIRKVIEEFYPGEYEFIHDKNIRSNKYQDKDKYRYKFVVKTNYTSMRVYNDSRKSYEDRYIKVYTYEIIDRKMRKSYLNNHKNNMTLNSTFLKIYCERFRQLKEEHSSTNKEVK
ncbi:hypothetical protein [Flammeovirga sp. SubArs3]|uniref:hypothetical protein n=1 Tax=Flammeovirga sp. SubArs3 TaxID=2995316 RepID=UPI00248AD2E9|nr:hypothetical protein [Flammeovirga sp. SubArs3]